MGFVKIIGKRINTVKLQQFFILGIIFPELPIIEVLLKFDIFVIICDRFFRRFEDLKITFIWNSFVFIIYRYGFPANDQLCIQGVYL